MKTYLDCKLNFTTTFFPSNSPSLGFEPTMADYCETFQYFMLKYNQGLDKKSEDYYYFWLYNKYPLLSEEEFIDGFKLQSKKVTTY
jgi:hypothetical protein